MIHGYMISSSDSKKVAAQLKEAGCDDVHRDTRGSAKSERAQRRKAVEQLKPGDVLVVAGKGHEQGQTIGTTVHPFDDASLIRSLTGGGA